MTLEEARRLFAEIIERYGIQFSDYQEEQRAGQIKDVILTIRIRVDQPSKKIIDKNIATRYT